MGRKNRLPKEPKEAVVERLSHDGRGIAVVDGITTFIFGALPGERVMFQYKSKKSKMAEGFVKEVLEASPERIEAKCAVFGICGGCRMQHISSEKQIKLKQETLAEQFKHFGGTEPEEWLDPLVADIWGYRRKARMGVKFVDKKGGALVGFREFNGRFLADMSRCEILHSTVGERIGNLRELINGLEGAKIIPQIEVAADDTKTALVIRHLEELSDDDLEKIKAFAKEFNFVIYLQPKGLDSIHLFYPENAELSYQLPKHDIKISFHPTDFTQVNGSLNPKMMDLALELLNIKKTDRILDLFCGLGNFTLPLARYAKEVAGVEGDKTMTDRALENAKANGIDNVSFYVANLFEEKIVAPWTQTTYDKVLLDPPRAGAEAAVQNIDQFDPKKILYVSCNPATLARDAKILVSKGYKLKKAGVMDMFPHTAHVESIALFER